MAIKRTEGGSQNLSSDGDFSPPTFTTTALTKAGRLEYDVEHTCENGGAHRWAGSINTAFGDISCSHEGCDSRPPWNVTVFKDEPEDGGSQYLFWDDVLTDSTVAESRREEELKLSGK